MQKWCVGVKRRTSPSLFNRIAKLHRHFARVVLQPTPTDLPENFSMAVQYDLVITATLHVPGSTWGLTTTQRTLTAPDLLSYNCCTVTR